MASVPSTNLAHDIFIAKSQDYLVFKLTSEAKIYMMGICDFAMRFNVTSFDCESCGNKKSFGIQTQECEPCSTLWFSTRADEVDFAKYQYMCTSGQTKSIFLMILVPIAVLVCSGVCALMKRRNIFCTRKFWKKPTDSDESIQISDQSLNLGKFWPFKKFNIFARRETISDDQGARQTTGQRMNTSSEHDTEHLPKFGEQSFDLPQRGADSRRNSSSESDRRDGS